MAQAELGNLTVVEASDEFLAAFTDAIAPVEAAWVEKAKEAGLEDPAATLSNFRDRLKAAQTN